MRGKERGLSFELVDRAVDVWLPFPNAHVAGKVTRRQIVGAIDYDVVIADQLDGVAGGQSCRVGLDDDRWVDGKQTRARRIGFLATNVVRSMQELPVKIAKINRVLIHDSESSDAGGGEIKRCWRTQPAGSDAQYPRFFQSALTFFARSAGIVHRSRRAGFASIALSRRTIPALLSIGADLLCRPEKD